jgi:type IV fimbrial biogenesis protein FimT
MKSERKHQGFTLVETMVTVSILALLTAIAVPTLRNVVQNGQIRAAAQSLQSGLVMARSEAVRLNTQVQFVVAGSGWRIEQPGVRTALQSASGRDATAGVSITRVPGTADRITFNSLGRATAINPDGSAPLSRLDVESSNPSGSSTYRPLAIELISGGLARICDPHAASTEPKACRT